MTSPASRGLRYAALAALAPLLLGGCLAKTVVDVATVPVKATSRAVDLATTSQSEADEKRGREIRRREEELGKLDTQLRKQEERCLRGDDRACREAVETRRDIETLSPSVPVERR
ncbi:hypothetical protein GRI89_13290 [Altererythrobacter salegens]|uniref:Lipoprotein n=1 Tax=Croceibacterium salegens TaxID=1737568 RepID=A0A6I4SWL5_9SPHN|nr:hypothetical protein [Croceibacterium salegens]MXO60514.1 hypothetical protein [Croceibacterium salegens]